MPDGDADSSAPSRDVEPDHGVVAQESARLTGHAPDLAEASVSDERQAARDFAVSTREPQQSRTAPAAASTEHVTAYTEAVKATDEDVRAAAVPEVGDAPVERAAPPVASATNDVGDVPHAVPAPRWLPEPEPHVAATPRPMPEPEPHVAAAPRWMPEPEPHVPATPRTTPEPAAPAPLALPPNSDLVMVETRFAAPIVETEAPVAHRPRRERRSSTSVPDEPLQMVETRKDQPSA
jgi:hypothetical protein